MIYRKDDIVFNDVKQSNVSIGFGGPMTTYQDYVLDENGEIKHRKVDYLVNAIDIHWGGVTIPETEEVITDTSDLIKSLNEAHKTIALLSQTIAELEAQINHDLNEIRNRQDEVESQLQTFSNSLEG